MALPGIVEATRSYEAWLGAQVPLIGKDLGYKHEQMRKHPFPFLRATFYRWAQRWPHDAGPFAGAPEIVAVGDLHVENFGLWRDREGRLVWGVNDFDEACRAPYTNDLLRLAVSAMLAADEREIDLGEREACEAVLDGYRGAIGGKLAPVVLAERHVWLRKLVAKRLRNPHHFWAKLLEAEEPDPAHVSATAAILGAALPRHHQDPVYRHRQSGLGSLGRPRVAVVAQWCGGAVAREAKAVAASAWAWAAGRPGRSEPIHTTKILGEAVRSPDPFLTVDQGWTVRRLAADNSRLELGDMRDGDHARLLAAMGRETANVHGGLRATRETISRHLAGLDAGLFRDTACRMRDAVVADRREWKRASG